MPAHLNVYDYAVLVAYLVATVGLGFWVSRGGMKTSKDYFLGGRTLPWYVVGGSMVATDISSEHFIANTGAAYKYGVVVAAGGWNTWIVYSLLIWIFLPYYFRTGLTTMPEFLSRRYNAICRYAFAVILIVGYIIAIIGGTLYSGGLALESIFGIDFNYGLAVFAITTAIYTVYGGLKSAAWTDFMQMVLLLVAGILVPVLALKHAGSLAPLLQSDPEKFQVFHPPTHKPFPFTGVFTGFLTVGIWYSCTSQHIVQRVLSAKDEWHARMGVVSAGLLRIITPLFFVLPGLAAIKLFPNLDRPDQAYLALVTNYVPTGLKGLILAGLAAALMSTLSTVVNSTSSLLTLDLYKQVKRGATEEQQLRFGRWSSVGVFIIGVLVALVFAANPETPLFIKMQDVFFYLAPPFAVIFTLGILWRRGNAIAAVTTIVTGFLFTWVLDVWLFPGIALLTPYNTYLHRALLAWFFCMAVMIVTSLLTAPPPREKTDGIIWSRRYASLPAEEAARYRGWQDFRVWWLLFIAIVLSIYAFFLWFRIRHPW